MTKPRTGSRTRSTREAILDAAIREFAMDGVAGARIEAIARSARVNKALLYYYFKDKESLYGAVLEQVFGGLRKHVDELLDRDISPPEKMLAFVGAYFDYIASHPLYPRVVQREMMRAGPTGSPHLKRIVSTYLRPLFGRLSQTIRQGIQSGEFRPVDPMQFVPSVVAVIVFYFGASPVIRIVSGRDPFSSEQVAARRAAVLDFVSAALFRPEAVHRSFPHAGGSQ